MTESMIAGMDQMNCTVVSSNTFPTHGCCVVLDLSFVSRLPFAASFSQTVSTSESNRFSFLTDCHPPAGTQPQPSITTSPRSCPAGQFSCPPPGGCIEAVKRCDGIPHCQNGEDERGCRPYNSTETQSDRYSLVFVLCFKANEIFSHFY